MVSRSIQQLNRPVSGEYRCRNDHALTLEGDGYGLARLLGYTAEEAPALDGVSFWELVSVAKRIHVQQELAKQLDEGGEVELIMPLDRKDGTEVWVLNRGRRVVDADGSEYIVGVLVEAACLKHTCDTLRSKLEQYQLKLSQTQDIVSVLQVRAEQDSLTGLFNASTTRRLVEEYLAASGPERYCALLIIDVDDFKQVNDHYGHMVGDEVLTHASAIIKKLFRSQDIVGRVGGDEFLVLMKDVPDRGIAEKRCTQLVAAFHDISCERLPEGTLSCSVGVALSEVCGDVYHDLFCCADEALYQAKGRGGDQFAFYDGEHSLRAEG